MHHSRRVGSTDPTVILNVYDLTPYNSYAYWCAAAVNFKFSPFVCCSLQQTCFTAFYRNYH